MASNNPNTKYIDYLKEDTPIPGQLWFCVSFLSPEGIKNCSVRGLKIRGVYGSKPEADKRAKELQEQDPDFHVFVGEMGKWLPWDPDPNDVEDNQYQEKELQKLMKGYKDNLEKSKRMQQQRKEDMIRQAAQDEQRQNRDQAARDKLRKKAEARKAQQKAQHKIDHVAKNALEVEESKQTSSKTMTDKEKELKKFEERLKHEEEEIEREREKLNKNKKQISETTKTLDTVDSKLARIQELYEKINKKE